MNKPNPLVPQGSFLDKGKSHIRITVFAILAVHVVLLGVLLIAGCNKKETGPQDPGLPPPVTPLTTDSNTWPAPPVAPNPTNPVGPAVTSPPPVAYVPPILPPIPVVDTPVTPTASEHTIVKGDSFYTLGKQYKVGYKSIADANPGVDSTKLKLGQKIKIPAPKSAGGDAASAAGGGVSAPASASTEKTYTVKSGDNLTKIAKTHGVTQREIQAANNLRTTQIRVGQKLKIPGKATPALPEAVPALPGTPGLPPDGTAPIRPIP